MSSELGGKIGLKVMEAIMPLEAK